MEEFNWWVKLGPSTRRIPGWFPLELSNKFDSNNYEPLKWMLNLKPNFLWFFSSRLFAMASNATMDKVAKAKATIELYYTTLLAHTRERKERYENICQSWEESEMLGT